MLTISARTTRRRLLKTAALLLAGGAVPLLPGCSTAIKTTAATAPPAVRKGTTVGASTLSGAPASALRTGGPATGTVTWLMPEDVLIDKWCREGVIPAFEQANPNAHVTLITPGSEGYGQKLLALVAAGQVPEVFSDWGGAGFFSLWDHQLPGNLSPYFNQAKVNPNYLKPFYLQEYTVQGNLYAVPWNSNPTILMYNKTLFQKYGLPSPPTDWKDKSWTTEKLLQTAQQLTHTTGNPATSTFGLIMGTGTCGTLAWLWNADPFNDKGGPEDSGIYQGKPLTAVYATGTGMVDAMSWLADLTNKYHVSPNPTDAQALSTLGNPIFSGRVGMQEVNGIAIRQAKVVKPIFEWGFAPFPFGPGGRNTPQREDNAWYLGRNSKNPDAGFRLILLASHGVGAEEEITIAENNSPVADPSYFKKWSRGYTKVPGFTMTEGDFAAVFEGALASGFGDPGNIIAHPLELINAFNQLMAPVWIGKQNAREGLQAVQAKWQGVVAAQRSQG